MVEFVCKIPPKFRLPYYTCTWGEVIWLQANQGLDLTCWRCNRQVDTSPGSSDPLFTVSDGYRGRRVYHRCRNVMIGVPNYTHLLAAFKAANESSVLSYETFEFSRLVDEYSNQPIRGHELVMYFLLIQWEQSPLFEKKCKQIFISLKMSRTSPFISRLAKFQPFLRDCGHFLRRSFQKRSLL